MSFDVYEQVFGSWSSILLALDEDVEPSINAKGAEAPLAGLKKSVDSLAADDTDVPEPGRTIIYLD